MRKITDFIVSKRNIILILFIILSGICLYTSTKVNINSDITKYLPNDSETKIGKEIMDSDFKEQKSSTLNVMFKNLSDDEKQTTYEELKKIDGVSSVKYENTDEYNKDNHTLYIITVNDYDHSKTAENVYNEVKDNFKVEAMSGSINTEYKPVLQWWIIALAISMAMVILTILSESYIEPWLYLFSIGIAVFINKGTNIIFPSVSNVTDAITAILQLALSMDYSIMLSNRYRQEREKEKDKLKAMKSALYDSFQSIASSSVTTIVGLLALVFMSFTIGRDLGIVLAKGVLLSLVSIFFCLPALLVLFDNQIINSKKKSLTLNLSKLGKGVYKVRWVQLISIIIIFIASYILKGNLGILYTGSEQDEVGKVFTATNQIAIVYENKYEDIISNYCKELEENENIDQVLCYGNTINEKLAYNELNKKFKDLGQDTEIDEYLIKIIYYNYYNKDSKDSMTLDEFIKFIKSDVYENNNISNSIDNNQKDNISLLENFSTKDKITQKRTIKEISNILGIDEKDASDLMILYNSKYDNPKMTIKDFVNFILNEVSKDENYSSSIDATTLASLNQLKPFIDENTINKKMTSKEISSTFGIDESIAEQLFLFYRTTLEPSSTMTINQFSKFALELKNNPSYSNMFDTETIKKLTLLELLSNDTVINKEYTAEELSTVLNSLGITNLDTKTLNLLYFYNYYLSNIENGTYNTTTKLSLNEFINSILMDNNINFLIPESINTYKPILQTFSNKTIITTELNKIEMSELLTPFGFEETQIHMVYASIYQSINPTATPEEIMSNTTIKLTPYRLLNIIKSSLTPEDPRLAQITLLINIMDLSYNETYDIVPTYDYQTLTTYLSSINNEIKISTISLAYGYYDYKNTEDNTYKTMSIKKMINFIITNKENPMISSNLGNNIELLSLGYKIVNNTNTKYSYKDLSILIDQPNTTTKNIYNLYDYKVLPTKLSPKEFVNVILTNQNNELISSRLNKETLNKLKLVNTVMNSTLTKQKYDSKGLSDILGSNKDTISLVMSLYNSKYNKTTQTISIYNFTDFIIKDVITNPTYANKIDSNSQTKLKAINSVMDNTLSNKKYNPLELYGTLNKLSDDLDYNIIDLVYIYHGSKNSYDESWKLTIEEVITYLNKDLLQDPKYKEFIDTEMSNKIKNAYNTITDSKDLLVTNKYSRAILNTKYASETEDTFEFIEDLQKDIGDKEGIYIVGDSPMALEMSKSFNSELNYITILTMLFIFVVVAFTFRDLLIPLILVLVIECAVSITTAILTLAGSSVYFIALLIVQAILMGATIDYAIVYTSYYKELRNKLNVQEALITAYNKSIHTILSSSSILIIVTLIVSIFSEAIPAKICETISQGTFCSAILILFILPGILAASDRLICRNLYKPSKK